MPFFFKYHNMGYDWKFFSEARPLISQLEFRLSLKEADETGKPQCLCFCLKQTHLYPLSLTVGV